MSKGNISTTNRLHSPTEPLKKLADSLNVKLRVAAPGIIQSFDSVKQTVKVQICIREKISLGGEPYADVAIPVLEDIPIFMPRAGNFVLTMPVTAGDECLVIFGDNCIDGWWQSGGVQNQLDRRRHDLSDGFAIIGVWSQPEVISDYSVDSARLRNLNNDSYVEVKDDIINIHTTSEVNVEANTVNINAGNEEHTTAPIVNVDCQSHRLDAVSGSIENAGAVKQITAVAITLTGGTILLQGTAGSLSIGAGNSQIDSKDFINHTHTAPAGGGTTSGVN